MGPAHRQNMASQTRIQRISENLTVSLAEFRGPGTRQQYDQDSPDDFDLDIRRGKGGRNGRIILLGDGTEVLTDNTDDADMFDHSMDDENDDDTHVKKEGGSNSDTESTRTEREDTPGPQSETDSDAQKTYERLGNVSRGPDTTIKAVNDNDKKA